MPAKLALLGAAAAVAAALLVLAPAGPAEPPQPDRPGTRSVLFVANNWDGTADIVDPKSFEVLDRFNVVPDLQERMAEIASDPVRLGYFVGIRLLIGEGNDQFADDMFSSHDGRFVYISRPSLADVVGMDLKTKQIVWRFEMEGQRSDHMAISPDGKRLLISDSTAKKVHELDAATGKKVGEFSSGDSPHESNYSADGKRVFHASIGLVYTPADRPIADSSKGERYFQVVEAGTNKILKRLDIGQLMRDNGFGEFSSAVRPMAISPDEKLAYLQLSFHHGFVVFDLVNDKPLRVVDLPKLTTEPQENYLLDSAHHGLAINPEGTKLCAAGTMDGYAAIVSTKDFRHTLIQGVDKPYWSTNSGDGKLCFVSASGQDKVFVIDYETERSIAEIPVGDHPQRMRMGNIRPEFLPGGKAANRPLTYARLQVRGARVKRGALSARVNISGKAAGKLRVTYKARGKRTSFTRRITGKRMRIRGAVKGGPRGMLTVRFPGSGRVAGDSVKLRAGGQRSALRVKRATVSRDGRLDLRGTISRRARGKVRVKLSYVGGGSRVRTLDYRARVKRGLWSVSALLPSQAARGGGSLSVVYRGHSSRGLRGEQVLKRLKPR